MCVCVCVAKVCILRCVVCVYTIVLKDLVVHTHGMFASSMALFLAYHIYTHAIWWCPHLSSLYTWCPRIIITHVCTCTVYLGFLSGPGLGSLLARVRSSLLLLLLLLLAWLLLAIVGIAELTIVLSPLSLDLLLVGRSPRRPGHLGLAWLRLLACCS